MQESHATWLLQTNRSRDFSNEIIVREMVQLCAVEKKLIVKFKTVRFSRGSR